MADEADPGGEAILTKREHDIIKRFTKTARRFE
jgi:hypothetical protein